MGGLDGCTEVVSFSEQAYFYEHFGLKLDVRSTKRSNAQNPEMLIMMYSDVH